MNPRLPEVRSYRGTRNPDPDGTDWCPGDVPYMVHVDARELVHLPCVHTVDGLLVFPL